jgi:hypothetical protein
MRWLAVAAIISVAASAPVASAGFRSDAPSECGGPGAWTDCTVENDGTQIDIGGVVTQPGGGNNGRDGSNDNGNNGNNGNNDGTTDGPPAPRYDEDGNLLRPGCNNVLCRDSYSVGVLPDVTLADLASFQPAVPTMATEPAGIGIVGMPTNLVAAASGQDIPGTLFGYDVVVRFTPTGYRFAYGDGDARTAPSGGASWASLGQAQFTPTGTSHAYAARGDYIATVTVQYAAEVSFAGGGWRDVDGVVEATSGGYGVRIVEARTALVDRTCAENPSGPGC